MRMMVVTNTIEFQGFITAAISKNNPLQTILELTLTDFQPNYNKQGIPYTEAQNIINSAHAAKVTSTQVVSVWVNERVAVVLPLLQR